MKIQQLKVAFWNVENLFDHLYQVGRGPGSLAEQNAKLDRLAECINGFFDNGTESPDLIALAEINTEALLHDLERRLNRRYHLVWCEPAYDSQTGLAVLYRDPVEHVVKVDHQTMGRPRSLVVRCYLPDKRAFLFCVNHWKSNFRYSVAVHKDRLKTVEWIRDTIKRQQDGCVVLAGDFNTNPTDVYFDDTNLRCTYHFSKATRRAGLFDERYYNTAWRFLTEPRYWEDLKANLHPEERPKGSHIGQFMIWDQLLVNGNALRGMPLKLIERSVEHHCGPLNSKVNQAGVLKPVRWNFNNGTPEGASDHLPVLARFEIH